MLNHSWFFIVLILISIHCFSDVCDQEENHWDEQEQQDQFLEKDDTIHIPYFSDDDWLIPEADNNMPQESEWWSTLKEKEVFYDENGDPYYAD